MQEIFFLSDFTPILIFKMQDGTSTTMLRYAGISAARPSFVPHFLLQYRSFGVFHLLLLLFLVNHAEGAMNVVVVSLHGSRVNYCQGIEVHSSRQSQSI